MENEPKYDIMSAFKRVQEGLRHHFVAKFKDFGFTGPQAILISIIAHSGAMKVSDISDKMHLSNSTVSSMIDRLEAQGFVSRVRSKEDKRVVTVDLTEDFRGQAKHRFCSIESEMSSLLAKATEEEKTKILEGLMLFADLINPPKENKEECDHD